MVLRPRNFIEACAGYGGLGLGVKIADPTARAVCYIEREASAAAVLVARMADQTLDQAPVWSDVTSFDAQPWRGSVDILVAGYPCQGESYAGKRRLDKDPRWIFGHIASIVKTARIPVVFCENVRRRNR